MSSANNKSKTASAPVRAFWYALLCLLGLVSIWWPLFNRVHPELFGLPFFVWFQAALILVSAIATGLALKAGA
jgi:hypothetical protein